MHPSQTIDSLLDHAIPASRSDALKVAVGFSPRKSAPLAPRRVATLETAPVLSHASLRDATKFPLFRGLKPTATFTLSLRDGTGTGYPQWTMHTSHTVDWLLDAAFAASRSDALKVAEGFSPWHDSHAGKCLRPIPKGLHLSAQGWRAQRLPWVSPAKKYSTPTGLHPLVQTPVHADATFSGLVRLLHLTQGSSRARNPGLMDGIPLGFTGRRLKPA